MRTSRQTTTDQLDQFTASRLYQSEMLKIRGGEDDQDQGSQVDHQEDGFN
jgi:hypothetical protein